MSEDSIPCGQERSCQRYSGKDNTENGCSGVIWYMEHAKKYAGNPGYPINCAPAKNLTFQRRQAEALEKMAKAVEVQE